MTIQSEGFNILDPKNPTEVACNIVNKAKDLSNNVSLNEAIKQLILLKTFYQILNKFNRVLQNLE